MPATIAAVWVIAILGGALIWAAMKVDEHRKLSKRSRELHLEVGDYLAVREDETVARIMAVDLDREYEELCRRG